MKPFNLIVYSPSGHGKTYLAGSGVGDPRISPMLLLDFEAGVDSIESRVCPISLADLPKVDKPPLDKVTVVRINTWSDFQHVHSFLSGPNNPYRMVVLDSLSEMNYLNMSEALRTAILLDKGHDPDIAEQRDYLRSYSQMRRLVRVYRDLNIHVMFTCAAQTVQDTVTKEYVTKPTMAGKLTDEIPHLVKVVGYLAVVDPLDGTPPYRTLLTQPTGRFTAKDRTEGGKLSPRIDNPTLPKIFDLLTGVVAG